MHAWQWIDRSSTWISASDSCITFSLFIATIISQFFQRKWEKKALVKTGLAKTGPARPHSTPMLPIEANYLLVWIPRWSSTSDSHKHHRHWWNYVYGLKQQLLFRDTHWKTTTILNQRCVFNGSHDQGIEVTWPKDGSILSRPTEVQKKVPVPFPLYGRFIVLYLYVLGPGSPSLLVVELAYPWRGFANFLVCFIGRPKLVMLLFVPCV